MNPLNSEQLEKLLKTLPQFERNKKAEALFYMKLRKISERNEWREKSEKVVEWWMWPKKIAFAGAFAVLILFVTGTVWSYSNGVTRGHFMYSWKRNVERIELAFAFSPLSEVETHLRFSDRRLDEANEIVSKSPSLAWLIKRASAHEGEIHLETEEAVNLALTLQDMRYEVQTASLIVEKKVTRPAEATAALQRIENTADRHVTILVQLEKKVKPDIKAIVKKIADEEDEHIAAVVEVKEEVKLAEAKQEKTFKVSFVKIAEQKEPTEEAAGFVLPTTPSVEKPHIPEKPIEKHTPERKDKALAELEKTLFISEALKIPEKVSEAAAANVFPESEKKEIAEKIEMAKKAFVEGKFGKAEGLSRAIQKQLEKSPVPPSAPIIRPEVKEFEERKEKMENELKNRKEKMLEEFKKRKELMQKEASQQLHKEVLELEELRKAEEMKKEWLEKHESALDIDEKMIVPLPTPSK